VSGVTVDLEKISKHDETIPNGLDGENI